MPREIEVDGGRVGLGAAVDGHGQGERPVAYGVVVGP